MMILLVYLIIIVVIILVSVVIFDKRYQGRNDNPKIPPGFRKTEETFRDPITGEWLTVYYNESTGERIYRP